MNFRLWTSGCEYQAMNSRLWTSGYQLQTINFSDSVVADVAFFAVDVAVVGVDVALVSVLFDLSASHESICSGHIALILNLIYLYHLPHWPLPTQSSILFIVQVRGYISPKHYLQTLLCENILLEWMVDITVLPCGGSWVRYRKGIDSVWTGIGMSTIRLFPNWFLVSSSVSTSNFLIYILYLITWK